MFERATHSLIANLKRTAGAMAVAGLLAAPPALAQSKSTEGGPPPADGSAADTLKRMKADQASRMRDMLTMIALAASKQLAISVGSIDVAADGTSFRIKNVVIVDRQARTVQVLPLIEIEDLDRTHAISRHFRAVIYADVAMGTLPPMVQPIIQGMGVKSLASRLDLEIKFDEKSGVMDIKTMSMEWSGVAKIAFNLQLTNVPPVNDMILLAAQDRIEPRMGEIRLKSASLVLRNRSLNRVLDVFAGMFGRRPGGGSPIVAELERMKLQAQMDLQRQVADALLPAAKGPAIVTLALNSPEGVPLIQIEREMRRGPAMLQNLFQLKIEGRTVPADEALPPALPPESRDTSIDKDAKDPPAHVCDVVGALEFDTNRKAEGVPDAKLNVAQVLADCMRATIEYPAAARFHLQLGRALSLAGHKPMATAQIRKAAELGSDAAKKYLNELTPK